MQRLHPRFLKKLLIWNSPLSGFVAKINDKRKEKQTGRAGPTCSRCHTPSPVRMGTAGVSEARVLPEEGRGMFPPPCPSSPTFPSAAWGHGPLAESLEEEMVQSRDTESLRQRSRDPISPPPTPKSEWQCKAGGRADARLPLLHDGRASSLWP